MNSTDQTNDKAIVLAKYHEVLKPPDGRRSSFQLNCFCFLVNQQISIKRRLRPDTEGQDGRQLQVAEERREEKGKLASGKQGAGAQHVHKRWGWGGCVMTSHSAPVSRQQSLFILMSNVGNVKTLYQLVLRSKKVKKNHLQTHLKKKKLTFFCHLVPAGSWINWCV